MPPIELTSVISALPLNHQVAVTLLSALFLFYQSPNKCKTFKVERKLPLLNESWNHVVFMSALILQPWSIAS